MSSNGITVTHTCKSGLGKPTITYDMLLRRWYADVDGQAIYVTNCPSCKIVLPKLVEVSDGSGDQETGKGSS